jgi:hypothetical protein
VTDTNATPRSWKISAAVRSRFSASSFLGGMNSTENGIRPGAGLEITSVIDRWYLAGAGSGSGCCVMA